MNQLIVRPERSGIALVPPPGNGSGGRENGNPLLPAEVTFAGTVRGALVHFQQAPLGWKVKNLQHRARAVPALLAARSLGRLTGMVRLESALRAKYILPDMDVLSPILRVRDLQEQRMLLGEAAELVLCRRVPGLVMDYGTISQRVVTTAGVNFLVSGWQNVVEMEIMKYHASGTGTNAEAIGDTLLQVEATSIASRATGSLGVGASANIFETVGTQSYTGSGAITEHGLFSVITNNTITLWDRSVFSALNVVNGSSIQWTYDLTATAGG